MNAQELLIQPIVFLPPANALEGMSAGDAERRVNGVNHSIAEIVAHMAFWQDWFRRRAEGDAEPMIASAALGWPQVAEEAWPDVRDGFLTGLNRLAQVVEQLEPDAPIAPAFEFPMLAGYSARDVWEHVGQHNAHHMGQVVILRQFLGLWPPPAGSYTW
jgi:uncharacterized damage-inducible protein DinB